MTRLRHPNEVFSNMPTTAWPRASVQLMLENARRELRATRRAVFEAKVMVLEWEDRIADIESVLTQMPEER